MIFSQDILSLYCFVIVFFCINVFFKSYFARLLIYLCESMVGICFQPQITIQLYNFKKVLIFEENMFNSLWPRFTIRQHKSESTLVQALACCLMAPSLYKNKITVDFSFVRFCGLDLRAILHTLSVQATTLQEEFENYTFECIATSPRG